jgi:type IV secretion system protein VirB3
MFLGVPYVPFFLGAGTVMLLALYAPGKLFWLILLPPVIFVMRQMARRDEMIFRLLGLRIQVATRVRNRRERNGMWVLSANPYRDRPAPKKR